MSLKRRFLMGMISGAGSIVVKTALNVFLIPVIIYFLGADLYGLYVLMVSLVELSSILDMGVTTTLIKVLGAAHGAAEKQKALEMMSMGQMVFAGISIATLIGGFAFVPLFDNVFHLAANLRPIASACLWLVLFETAITLYTSYYRAILVAHCLNQWTNVGDTVFTVVANGLGLILLMQGWDLQAVMISRVLAAALRLILLLIQAYRVEPDALLPKVWPRLQTYKEVVHYSFHSFVINLSVMISHKIDYYVIAFFLPLRFVGSYEIVFRFLGICMQVVFKISEGLFPMFAHMISAQQTEELRALYIRMTGFTHYMTCFMLIVIVSFYPELFHIFSANKMPIQSTIPVLIVAIPCIWSGAMQIPAGYYLFCSGRQRYLSASSLTTALCNLTLSIILVQPFGIVGVALGTLIPQLIQHQGFLITKVCRAMGISFGEYMRTVMLRPVIPLAIILITIHLLRPLMALSGSPIATMIAIGTVACIEGILFWLVWFASPNEKQFFHGKFKLPLRQKWLDKWLVYGGNING